jgi:hypothetical protein
VFCSKHPTCPLNKFIEAFEVIMLFFKHPVCFTVQVCAVNADCIIMYLTAGLGVIDFEKWRPIWRQNWASMLPYQDVSRKIERRRQPFWWTPKQIEAEVTGSHWRQRGRNSPNWRKEGTVPNTNNNIRNILNVDIFLSRELYGISRNRLKRPEAMYAFFLSYASCCVS